MSLLKLKTLKHCNCNNCSLYTITLRKRERFKEHGGIKTLSISYVVPYKYISISIGIYVCICFIQFYDINNFLLLLHIIMLLMLQLLLLLNFIQNYATFFCVCMSVCFFLCKILIIK